MKLLILAILVGSLSLLPTITQADSFKVTRENSTLPLFGINVTEPQALGVIVFRSSDYAKEYRALMRAKAKMSFDAYRRMTACTAPLGSRVIVVEKNDDGIARVVVDDGRLEGPACRGYIVSQP